VMALRILEAFCVEFGVQERDLGEGLFHSRQSPLGTERCQGMCIFDATNGSLRLTQRLAENFADVVSAATSIARSREDLEAFNELENFAGLVRGLRSAISIGTSSIVSSSEGDRVVVIAPGERAMYVNEDGTREVEVIGYRYTPQGLYYDLKHQQPDTRWSVPASAVQPIHEETRMIRVNLVTGETEPLE